MTPAMASEPYCADAPSRSTSMDCTAAFGMVFKSTAAAPRPIVPLTLTREAAWRRLELSSTSVWSGDRPRKVAGRIVSVPSARPGRGKLYDRGDGIQRRAILHARARDDDLLEILGRCRAGRLLRRGNVVASQADEGGNDRCPDAILVRLHEEFPRCDDNRAACRPITHHPLRPVK